MDYLRNVPVVDIRCVYDRWRIVVLHALTFYFAWPPARSSTGFVRISESKFLMASMRLRDWLVWAYGPAPGCTAVSIWFFFGKCGNDFHACLHFLLLADRLLYSVQPQEKKASPSGTQL
jgi:hypothetical protein